MSGIARTAHRIIQSCVKSPGFSTALTFRNTLSVKCDISRTIWTTSKKMDNTSTFFSNHSNVCLCGCSKAIHTKNVQEDNAGESNRPRGEKELVEFLTEEIVAERKAQKLKNLPQELNGFKVVSESAEIILTKQLKDEIIKISFNVNHSVDSENSGEGQDSEREEFSEMQSKPQFEVDIIKGDTTLGFTCSYMEGQEAEGDDDYGDVFGINEVTLYKGEWNDKVYAVAGDVLDGYLYDLLMNLLDEKGVSNEFVSKLSDLSTAYEHMAYINLLEGISKFTIGQK